jgi:integrase
MRWSDYKDGVLSVTQQKVKLGAKPTKLILPVHNALRIELDRWKAEALSVFILVTEKRRPWAPEYLSWSIGSAVRDAGLPPGLNVHGLRKLAATTFADLGCSPHHIKAITGHKTLAMVEHYTRSVSQEHLAREAMDIWERDPSFTKIGRIYRPRKDE